MLSNHLDSINNSWKKGGTNNRIKKHKIKESKYGIAYEQNTSTDIKALSTTEELIAIKWDR
jgi:hypothetical protein